MRPVAARQRLPGTFGFHKALVAQLRVVLGRLPFIIHPQSEQVLRQNFLAIVFDTGPLSPLQGRHWGMTALRAFPFGCSNLVPLSVGEMRLCELLVTHVAPPSLHLRPVITLGTCVALPVLFPAPHPG